MKKAEFTRNVYKDGAMQYEAGKQYEITPDIERWIRRGAAFEVEVREKPGKGTAKQIKAARAALASAEDAVAGARQGLNVASDEDLPAAQAALSEAEGVAETARAELAALEGQE